MEPGTRQNNSGNFKKGIVNYPNKVNRGPKAKNIHKSIAEAFKAGGLDIGDECLKHYQRLMNEGASDDAMHFLKYLLPYVYATKKIEIVDDGSDFAEDKKQVEQSAQELIKISEDAA